MSEDFESPATEPEGQLVPPARRPPTAVGVATPPPPRPPRPVVRRAPPPSLWRTLRRGVDAILDTADSAAELVRTVIGLQQPTAPPPAIRVLPADERPPAGSA